MKLHKFKDRGSVYKKLHMYEKRLKEIREKHTPNVYGRHASPEYLRESKNIKTGIRRYKRLIKEIDKRRVKIVAIGNALCYFSGVNVKNSITNNSPKAKESRGIFYKYCLEHGIPGTLIQEYVGGSRHSTPSEGRKAFTNSFKTNLERKQRYMNFIQYIKEKEEAN